MTRWAYSLGILILTLVGVAGCDNKEEVFELETPGTSVEVEQDKDTGGISVDVDDN